VYDWEDDQSAISVRKSLKPTNETEGIMREMINLSLAGSLFTYGPKRNLSAHLIRESIRG
jgi:hypothetical protein